MHAKLVAGYLPYFVTICDVKRWSFWSVTAHITWAVCCNSSRGTTEYQNYQYCKWVAQLDYVLYGLCGTKERIVVLYTQTSIARAARCGQGLSSTWDKV